MHSSFAQGMLLPLPPKNVALVSCSKKKRAGMHRAAELYNSPLFKFSFRFASRSCDEIWILSAKHGLVHPDKKIKSYNRSLKTVPRQEQRKWARRVAKAVTRHFPKGTKLEFYCGEVYLRDLISLLNTSFVCIAPLRGLSLGKQLQWYKERIG